MVRHAPKDYACPFCLFLSEKPDERTQSVPSDLVYRDDAVTAFICAKQWPRNPGHVLVVPNAHYENLYELPDELGGRIHAVARRIALAMKTAYGCDGVSTRQHNEPAGNQEVWHYHLHVIPRYEEDDLYGSEGGWAPVPERAAQAQKLRDCLS